MNAPDRIEVDQAQVTRLREDGKSWPEIAAVVGCSLTTIKRRSKRWGLVDRATEAVEEAASRATRVASAKWTLRRVEQADLAGMTANAARRVLSDLLPTVGLPIFDDKGDLVSTSNGHGLDVYRLARTYEILIKQAQLLSGGATERAEVFDDEAFDDEYKRLVKELRDNPASADS